MKVVPKVLRGCAEGAWRLRRRCFEVVPKVVEVLVEDVRLVNEGCAEGASR